MTGSALFDFIIGIIVLFAVVAIFMIALPKISTDETFTKIARIVIGVLALIVFLIDIRAVLFGGGGAGSPVTGAGLVTFGIAIIVGLLVLIIVNILLDKFGALVGLQDWTNIIKLIIGALVLIALIYVAGDVLVGGGGGSRYFRWFQHTFNLPGPTFSARAALDLQGMLT
jgi:hypothetical protein